MRQRKRKRKIRLNTRGKVAVATLGVIAAVGIFFIVRAIVHAQTQEPEVVTVETEATVPAETEPAACIEYTNEDLAWLQKCVQAEQGDFSYRASYLTASCIVNRALTRGMTITEVIFEDGAFEVVSNGWIYDAEPSDQTLIACSSALISPEEWCLAFSVGHQHDSWADPVEEIDTPWGTTEVFYTYDH